MKNSLKAETIMVNLQRRPSWGRQDNNNNKVWFMMGFVYDRDLKWRVEGVDGAIMSH